MGHRLSRIVTRTGDAGTTGLGDGSRVSKTSARIEAIGAVDELNSSVGVVLVESLPPPFRQLLTDIQHESHGMITSALHVHLDRHTCLEVIPLRGAVQAIERLANDLLSVKGVRYGQLVPATTGKMLT